MAGTEAANDLSFPKAMRLGERELQLIKISFSGGNVNVQVILWLMLFAKGHSPQNFHWINRRIMESYSSTHRPRREKKKSKKREKNNQKSCSWNDHGWESKKIKMKWGV